MTSLLPLGAGQLILFFLSPTCLCSVRRAACCAAWRDWDGECRRAVNLFLSLSLYGCLARFHLYLVILSSVSLILSPSLLSSHTPSSLSISFFLSFSSLPLSLSHFLCSSVGLKGLNTVIRRAAWLALTSPCPGPGRKNVAGLELCCLFSHLV